jgi:hypothetical protein
MHFKRDYIFAYPLSYGAKMRCYLAHLLEVIFMMHGASRIGILHLHLWLPLLLELALVIDVIS